MQKRPNQRLFSALRLSVVATAVAATLGLCSCSMPDTPTAELGYVNMSNVTGLGADSGINNIRYQALQETATRIGAQGALAWRARQINNVLTSESQYLDSIFDFNQLLINGDVLPPVLAETSGNINLANSDTIRVSDKTYKILSPSRFVTTPPTWRSYLWMNYSKPNRPDITLLPKNPAETQVWNAFLKQGWKQGLEQANEIFSANLSRLKQDYLGMVLYRKLLSEHMITSPYVAKANLGVTGNGHEIHVDDRIYRITNHSALIPNSKVWKPVITSGS